MAASRDWKSTIFVLWGLGFVVLAFVAFNALTVYEGLLNESVEKVWGWPLPAVAAIERYECSDKRVWCCGRCQSRFPIEHLREHPDQWTLRSRGSWQVFWPFLFVDLLCVLGALTVVGGAIHLVAKRLMSGPQA